MAIEYSVYRRMNEKIDEMSVSSLEYFIPFIKGRVNYKWRADKTRINAEADWAFRAEQRLSALNGS